MSSPPFYRPTTLQEALARASAAIDRRDAQVLLGHLLRRDRAWLLAHPATELSPEQLSGFNGLVARRAAHEPLQYLTGHQEFFGLDLTITPDVLIPRPETEILVEAVLHWARAQPQPGVAPQPLRLVDIGTGSGAIALALATHLPSAEITAVDLSPAALSVARGNAVRLNLADRVSLRESNLLHAMAADLASGLRFDAIVSNPPYVSDADAATMQPEVREFEPHTALFAGPEGLAIYRRLIPEAFAALRPGGLLALEIGFGQRDALASLLTGWHEIRFVPDLAGIPRVALALRP